MEKICRLLKIRDEYYLVSGYNHKVGGWCLFYDSPSKVISEGESIEIISRVIVTEDDAEFLNKIRIKKGEKPIAIGDVSSMTHSFHGESMPVIIATTDSELINDGIPSIKNEDLTEVDYNHIIVEFDNILVGECGCNCHAPGGLIRHITACCHPKEIEDFRLNKDGSIKIKNSKV